MSAPRAIDFFYRYSSGRSYGSRPYRYWTYYNYHLHRSGRRSYNFSFYSKFIYLGFGWPYLYIHHYSGFQSVHHYSAARSNSNK